MNPSWLVISCEALNLIQICQEIEAFIRDSSSTPVRSPNLIGSIRSPGDDHCDLIALNNARNDQADYWKSMMKGKPIPKAIEELVHGDSSSSETINMEHFNKAFDTRPNHILYHSHIVKEDLKQGHEIDSDQGEMIQSSVKPVKPRIKFPEYNQAQKDHIYMHFLYRKLA
ncbi:hypothetical protein TEA_023904 [Camellia sinensis var. sinensis]|uniref:Uncharacterized protein n=1 Tax=Camellia sinensis var. sinensis TaxID=542762 RepID=A0A4V6RYI9_CAMSN|nr:hypothetical protein TEA_023904 [Camellia sinensis var. sinensis]